MDPEMDTHDFGDPAEAFEYITRQVKEEMRKFAQVCIPHLIWHDVSRKKMTRSIVPEISCIFNGKIPLPLLPSPRLSTRSSSRSLSFSPSHTPLQNDTFIDSVKAFYHAVDWSERWLQGLLAAELLLLVTVVVTRRRPAVQTAIFFTTSEFESLISNLLL
jgi:hypothetical protein